MTSSRIIRWLWPGGNRISFAKDLGSPQTNYYFFYFSLSIQRTKVDGKYISTYILYCSQFSHLWQNIFFPTPARSHHETRKAIAVWDQTLFQPLRSLSPVRMISSTQKFDHLSDRCVCVCEYTHKKKQDSVLKNPHIIICAKNTKNYIKKHISYLSCIISCVCVYKNRIQYKYCVCVCVWKRNRNTASKFQFY